MEPSPRERPALGRRPVDWAQTDRGKIQYGRPNLRRKAYGLNKLVVGYRWHKLLGGGSWASQVRAIVDNVLMLEWSVANAGVDERFGISVCPSVSLLKTYVKTHGGTSEPPKGRVLVQIEGIESSDFDLDASGPGAPFLIMPVSILKVGDRPVDMTQHRNRQISILKGRVAEYREHVNKRIEEEEREEKEKYMAEYPDEEIDFDDLDDIEVEYSDYLKRIMDGLSVWEVVLEVVQKLKAAGR